MAFTAPQEAAVVTAANRLLAATPKRTSLPSMLPPACRLLAAWSTPSAVRPPTRSASARTNSCG